MNKILVRLCSLLALSTLVSGCVFSTDRIDLAYNPRGARDKISGAEGVKVQVAMADKREIRDVVGRKTIGMKQRGGKIVSTTDVVEVVRGAIESELAMRGFSKGEAVVVSCDLNQFYNHFTMGFWAGDSFADVNLTVQVKTPSGEVVFSKEIAAQGKEPNIQVVAGHNAQPSLEQALSNAVDELFSDPGFVPALFKAAGMNPPNQS